MVPLSTPKAPTNPAPNPITTYVSAYERTITKLIEISFVFTFLKPLPPCYAQASV